MAAPPAKTLEAWKYFDINKNKINFAECKLCKTKLARDGTKSSLFNTSPQLRVVWVLCYVMFNSIKE